MAKEDRAKKRKLKAALNRARKAPKTALTPAEPSPTETSASNTASRPKRSFSRNPDSKLLRNSRDYCTAKVVYKHFFTGSTKTNDLTCKLCGEAVVGNTSGGYTNCQRHFDRCPGPVPLNWSKILQENDAKYTQLEMKRFMKTKTVVSNTKHEPRAAWLRLMLTDKLPFLIVESDSFDEIAEMFIGNCTCQSKKDFRIPTRKTVVKWSKGLFVLIVSRIIREIKGRKLVLMFDGWSSGTRHFIAMLACFKNKKGAYTERLLGFRTMLDERKQDANEHKALFDCVMKMYKIELDQVLCFVGDHAKCNVKLCKKLYEKPFIGCFAHRVSLLVDKYIEAVIPDEIFTKIRSGMVWARRSNNWALLKLLIRQQESSVVGFAPILNNDTRWNSVQEMFERYEKLFPFLRKAQEEDGKDIDILDKKERDFVKLVLEVMQNQILPISKELQVAGCSVLRGRTALEVLYFRVNEMRRPNAKLYDAAIPEEITERYLNDGPEFHDFHCEMSEICIEKIAKGDKLNKSETIFAKKHFMPEVVTLSPNVSDQDNPDLKFKAEQQFKMRSNLEKTHKYTPVDWIPCSSAAVERIFSRSKLFLTDRRIGLLKESTIQMLMVLNVNREIWDDRLAELVARGKGFDKKPEFADILAELDKIDHNESVQEIFDQERESIRRRMEAEEEASSVSSSDEPLEEVDLVGSETSAGELSGEDEDDIDDIEPNEDAQDEDVDGESSDNLEPSAAQPVLTPKSPNKP